MLIQIELNVLGVAGWCRPNAGVVIEAVVYNVGESESSLILEIELGLLVEWIRLAVV